MSPPNPTPKAAIVRASSRAAIGEHDAGQDARHEAGDQLDDQGGDDGHDHAEGRPQARRRADYGADRIGPEGHQTHENAMSSGPLASGPRSVA